MPDWLKPSAAVDLIQVLVGARPTLRTELRIPASADTVRRWARGLGLYVAIDIDGFVAMSYQPGAARRLLALDRSPGDHTRQLGLLLGYPACCCRAAAFIGEASIDDWAKTASRRLYFGRFKAINPSGYREGRSLISHVPCSTSCGPSLAIAVATMKGRARIGGRYRLTAKRRHQW